MPRQDTIRVTERAQAAPSQSLRRVQSQVLQTASSATPNYIPQTVDPDVEGLIRGLSAFQPSLGNLLDQENQQAAQKGKLDAAAGEQAQDGSMAYHMAYFRTDGLVKAQQDGMGLLTKYNTEFDKDKGDVEGWIRDNYQGRLKNIQDKDYLSGYSEGILPALQEIRKSHLEYQKKAIETRVESNTMQLMDNVVGAYLRQGDTIPDDHLDVVKQTAASMGVSDTRFQQMLFEVVKKAGDKGHYEAYDLLKKPRADGSPGLFYSPEWMTKIDEAQLHSFTAGAQRAEQDRKHRYNSALYDVFAEDDPKKAQALFKEMKSSALFKGDAEGLIKWEKLLTEKVDGKPDIDQLDRESSLLQSVYSGKLSYSDIINERAAGKITSAQSKYLLSESRRVSSENRSIAAQEGKASEAIYKTTDFKSAEDFLQGMLRPRPRDNMDFTGQGNEFDRAQLATARLELTRAVQGKPASEVQPIAEEIVTRYAKRRKAFSEQQQTAVGENRVPFRNLQEARDAGAKGLLSPAELRRYIDYFKVMGN